MTLVAGRYQPLEEARPGTALRARDLQTAQTVLLRETIVAADTAGATHARAQSATGIFHPSLVTLFDAILLDESRLLLAYEFVPAQTLAQASGGQAFSARRAAAIVSEIADAVAELHARELAHGAISQATVLVTLKGKAKLDRLADPSMLRGTPTPHTDILALGELLRGLAGSPSSSGVAGLQALEVIINRARLGKFESAATLAAMLRRMT